MNKKMIVIGIGFVVLLLYIASTLAASGATIISNSTETSSIIPPDSLSDARSTITTVVFDSIQQDQSWKAYVGNVSGKLTLDDADNNTIYDWSDLGAPSGEVYASRFSNIDFSDVRCAATSTINTEMTFNNMTGSEADSINNTFNYTIHSSFYVGAKQIPQNNCSSTALYVSDSHVVPTTTSDFQEILLEDNSNQFLYSSLINDDTVGFDDGVYDFQMIVAESNVKASPTTYYFYLELDG